jgi:hypothetical protein
MPDDILAPEDEGFFSWLSRPRRAVLNTLRGEYGMAADQALDFALNIPDALLPGDQIPEQSGPESDIEVGDLYDMEPGWKKTAVDIVGGIPLDPLTYVPIAGPIAKVTGAARQAAKAVPKLDQALTKGRNLVADTMNWHTMTPEQRAIETAAKSTGSMAARASTVEGERIAKGLLPAEQEAVFDAIQNVTVDPATKQAGLLTKRVTGVPQPMAANQLEALDSLRQTAAYKDAPLPRQQAMEAATRDAVELGQTQADEFLMGASGGAKGVSEGPYLQRPFDFADVSSPILREGTGAAQATKARALKTDQELMDALNADPAMMQAYQRNLPAALLKRAEQQGKIATRKTLGDNFYGKGFDITNTAHRADVVKKLEKMIEANGPDRDFAVRSLALFRGNGKLTGIEEALAAFNRNFFKPAATVGVVVPRVSFTVRNSLSSIAQALSTPGARGAALKNPKWIYDRIVGGIMDPLEELATKMAGKPMRIGDDTNRLLQNVDDAFTNAKGSVEKAKDFLRNKAKTDPTAQDALEALEQNILENPIKVDEVMSSINPDAPMWRKAAKGVWDIPSELNRHVEDRIRAGLFVAARRANQAPAAAAASVRNSVLDYSVPTIENRRMRTWIPFGAFMSQTLPQSAKLLAENVTEGGIAGGLAGGAARGAANAMFETDPENPIYPDMEGKLAVPMGRDEKGDPQYLTSFGLPMEGLGDLPMGTDNREFERFLGVAAHPLVKAGYSAVSGRDPFFGTPMGSYDKPQAILEKAGLERGPAAAKLRQILGTGIAQPAVHAMNLAEPWLDDRQDAGLDLLRAGTGVRVRSVDENQALKLNLEEALRQNPQIKQYSGYYKGSDDPETMDLMEDYNATKKAIKQRREAAKAEAAKVQ